MTRNVKTIKNTHLVCTKNTPYRIRLDCVGETAGVAQHCLKLGQRKRHLTAQYLPAKAASLALSSRFPSDRAELGYYIHTAPGEKHDSVQNLQRCSVEFPWRHLTNVKTKTFGRFNLSSLLAVSELTLSIFWSLIFERDAESENSGLFL